MIQSVKYELILNQFVELHHRILRKETHKLSSRSTRNNAKNEVHPFSFKKILLIDLRELNLLWINLHCIINTFYIRWLCYFSRMIQLQEKNCWNIVCLPCSMFDDIKYEIALLNLGDSISVCTINIRLTGYNIIFKLRKQIPWIRRYKEWSIFVGLLEIKFILH